LEHLLWPEELPSCTTIVLSGRDVIVPSKDVHRYISGRYKHTVMWNDDFLHGQFAVSRTTQRKLLKEFLRGVV
jgi:hypothetical protein